MRRDEAKLRAALIALCAAAQSGHLVSIAEAVISAEKVLEETQNALR